MSASTKTKETVCIACVGLFVIIAPMATGSARAQWDPLKQAREARDRLNRSIGTEMSRGVESASRAVGMHYTVQIVNPNSGPNSILYRFGDQPAILSPNTMSTHEGEGYPSISFDNGRSQTVSYRLENGRRYFFRWNNGVLDLSQGDTPPIGTTSPPRPSQVTPPPVAPPAPPSIAPPAPPSIAPPDTRSRWVYGVGQFYALGGGRWRDQNTSGTYDFWENYRNRDWVELTDPSRGYTVRLHNNVFYIIGGNNRVRHFDTWTKWQDGGWR